MPRTSTICRHDRRADIDRAIFRTPAASLAGLTIKALVLRDITKDYGPSHTLEGVGVPAILDDIERLMREAAPPDKSTDIERLASG